MDRPVVVNSLLCFIYNYRNHASLETILSRYFSDSIQTTAKNVLLDLLSDADPDSPSKDASLLAVFDRIASSEMCPVFAASDLTSLPISLLGAGADQNSPTNIFSEIQQLRLFIQNAFKGSTKEISRKR